MSDLFVEGFIFSGDDIKINMDKWPKGKNILFITGHSGSGKTTTAEEMADAVGATVIQLDWFACYHMIKDWSDYRKQDYGVQLVQYYFEKIRSDLIKIDLERIENETYYQEFKKFFLWIIDKVLKDSKRLYVIEGLQLLGNVELNFIKSYPTIIKDTSMITSIIRRHKREREQVPDKKMSTIDLFRQIKWYIETEGSLKRFRKNILVERGNILNLKINNSKSHAITGKWKDPGAKLYDTLLDSVDYGGPIPTSGVELNQVIADGKYKSSHDFLKEAYLEAPISEIKNGPHGRTPFSQSGCKYPHHRVKDDQLVLHIEGLKDSYRKAFRNRPIPKGVKAHLNRHLNELEIEVECHHGDIHFKEVHDIAIDNNFSSIEAFIERSNINPEKDGLDELFSEGWKDTLSKVKNRAISIIRKLSGGSINALKRMDMIMFNMEKLPTSPNNINGIPIFFPDESTYMVESSEYNNDDTIIFEEVSDKIDGIFFEDNSDTLSRVNIKNVAKRLRKKYKCLVMFVGDESHPYISSKMSCGVAAGRFPNSEIADIIRGDYERGNMDEDEARIVPNTPVIIINTKALAKTGIISEQALEDIMDHEYGHILTFGKVPHEKKIEQKIKCELLSNLGAMDSTVGEKRHYIYWMLPIEKAANDAVNLTPDRLAAGVPKIPKDPNWRSMKIAGLIQYHIDSYVREIEINSSDMQVLIDSAKNGTKPPGYSFYSDDNLEKIAKIVEWNLKVYQDLLTDTRMLPKITTSFQNIAKMIRGMKKGDTKIVSENHSHLEGLIERIDLMTSDPYYENYDDDLSWIESHLMKDEEITEASQDDEKGKGFWVDDSKSPPKNGANRKRLYMMFIEWAKNQNPKNSFGNVFDKDAFVQTYAFVPHDLRYFYRLSNPMLCILQGNLVFFSLQELQKLNAENPKIAEEIIFAATENDLRIYKSSDRKIYLGKEENGVLKLERVLANSFDLYLQQLINKGNILSGSN